AGRAVPRAVHPRPETPGPGRPAVLGPRPPLFPRLLTDGLEHPMEISDSNYPHTMAQAYSDMAVQGTRDLLAAQKANAQRASTGISDLRKALQAFETALDKLTGSGTGSVAHAASVSDAGAAKATASTGAAPGNYTFFVEQLASNHQLASGALAPAAAPGSSTVSAEQPASNPPLAGGALAPAAAAGAGTPGVSLADGSTFDVDLPGADGNGDGQLSAAEIARAINQAAGGKLSASTLTINGQQQLVLASNVGGADGAIALDTSGLGDAALAAALDGASELAEARNAVFILGGASGTRIEQGSNTFTGVQGVSLEFTAANATVALA